MNNKQITDLNTFNAFDLIAIAIRDLRKISVPVELNKQIAVPIDNCAVVLDYALGVLKNDNPAKAVEENTPSLEVKENSNEEVNQNGTE